MASLPINTYNGLKSYVLEATGRPTDPNLISQMDNFVYQAQLKLARSLNIMGTQTIINGTVNSGVFIIPTPPLFIRAISLTIYDVENANEPIPLIARTAEYMQMSTPNPSVTGIPKNYASQFAIDTLLISPTPKVLTGFPGYPYQLIYHQLTQPLSSSVQQNYFTERLSDILVLATLVQLYIYLRTPELKSRYEADLDKEIAAMTGQDALGKTDRAQKAQIN